MPCALYPWGNPHSCSRKPTIQESQSSSSGTSRSPSLWRVRPPISSRDWAAGSESRTLFLFLTLGRRGVSVCRSIRGDNSHPNLGYTVTPPQQSAHWNRATKRPSGMGILTPPWLGCNCQGHAEIKCSWRWVGKAKDRVAGSGAHLR